MERNTDLDLPDKLMENSSATEEAVPWLEQALPHIMRRLMDSENLDMPLLQLPLAQLRLAQALYKEPSNLDGENAVHEPGDTMSQLSDRLGVRHNALTQAADRLINHGLAERASDPRDRRIVRLRLTERGRAWVQARRERRRAHLTALWSRLNGEERAQFLMAVRTLEAIGRRLGPEPAGPQPIHSVLSPVQTVEETLTRFVAGGDTVSTSSMAASDAATTAATQHTTAEFPITSIHAISRKEDE